MNKTPRATLRIIDQPALGAVRLEVECDGSVTGLTHVPTAACELPDELLVTVVAFEHESRCGACDLEDVFAQGSQEARELAERLWAEFQGAMIMRGRRN